MGQIVHHHQNITSLGRKTLGNRHCGIRRDINQPRRILVACGNDDGFIHHAAFTDGADYLGHRITSLANGTIDADHAGVPLVQDRIDCDRGLARLPVADDQFALSQPHGYGSIDRFQPGRKRPHNSAAVQDFRRLSFDRVQDGRIDRSLPVIAGVPVHRQRDPGAQALRVR